MSHLPESRSTTQDSLQHTEVTPVRAIPKTIVPQNKSTEHGSVNRKSSGPSSSDDSESSGKSSDTEINSVLEDVDDDIDDVNDVMGSAFGSGFRNDYMIDLYSLLKYPGIADIALGAFVLFASKQVTELMEALSFVSIASGVYVFLVWLYTNARHPKTIKDTKSNLLAKIAHLIGGIILLVGHVALAILGFVELKDIGRLPIGSNSTLSPYTTGVPTSTVISADDSDLPLLSNSSLMGIDGGLGGIALLMLIIHLVATAYAVYAHHSCKLQLKSNQNLLDKIGNGN